MFKKIFIICFSGNRGGMELDAVRMSRRVSEYTRVILIGKSGSFLEELALEDISRGASFEYIGSKVSRFWARSFVDLNIITRVRYALLKEKPDALIFFGTSEVKSLGLALMGMDCKLILRLGTTINNAKNSFFQRIAYSRVDGFFALGDHIKSNILKSFPAAIKKPVEVIYPVYMLKENCRSINPVLESNKNFIKIIFHSRFVPGKGQIDAVESVGNLVNEFENIRLCLIGGHDDVEYVKAIKDFILKNKLDHFVKIFDNQINVIDYIKDSNIFIFPSYGEGFPNAFIEALHNGLVCVTYDNTAFPFFKKLGFDFIMTPTGNVQLLTQALREGVIAFKAKKINVERNIVLSKSIFSSDSEASAIRNLYNKLFLS